ncbi:MAG: hypothetical protein OEV00_03510 [Acidobacteriota bacterium]|nr:hypothetical protein [Acidobacteriota bacterium]MDH3784378.1 hypothetical protein [Acidobacteriota bacterium]
MAIALLSAVCAPAMAQKWKPVEDQNKARQDEPVVERVPVRYRVIATDLRINRRSLGESTHSIRGVPAEPVDALTYDGQGHTRLKGEAVIEVDPVHQRGLVFARWQDDHGAWQLQQTYFHHPEHSSGVRLGRSRKDVEDLLNLGIARNVYIHGDTGGGTPVLPTVFAYLATWGFVEVDLDGELFPNSFGWPGPERWIGHTMLTEGVIDDSDGTVRAIAGEIYDPKRHKSQGEVDRQDMELHIAFHDERYPLTENRPAMFAFKIHLIFEDVVLHIVDTQEPLDFSQAEAILESMRPTLGSDGL